MFIGPGPIYAELRPLLLNKLDIELSDEGMRQINDLCLKLRQHFLYNVYKGINYSTKELTRWVESLSNSELKSLITLIELSR
jgi:hypothetical protein